MRLLASLFVLAMVCVAPAKADYYIKSNTGGVIYNFLNELNDIYKSGERVRVEGPCYSACTLVLTLPRGRLCAGPHATFGFHAAWREQDGRKVTSAEGTALLRKFYPPAIKHWIAVHGDLSPKMIYLKGKELRALIPTCPHNASGRYETAFEGLEGAPPPFFTPPIRLNYVR